MIAACSETSFSPTRTRRPSSDRSNAYCWSRSSNSAALRTAVLAIALSLTCRVPYGVEQVVDRERLAERRSGAPLDLRLDLGGAADEDDRYAARAQLVEQGIAALVPDPHVQQHDPDALVELGARLLERGRLAHDESLELEIDPAEQPNRRLVVDD